MASGMTVTGLDDFRAKVSALPDRVRAASVGVALATGKRVLARAQANLAAQTKGSGRTAKAMTIDVENNAVIVQSKAPSRSPGNLPLWIEYGTVKQPARPYLGPAAKAESGQYLKELQRVVEGLVQQAVE